MKRHDFLRVEYQASARLTPAEHAQLKKVLAITSRVLEKLFREKIIAAKKHPDQLELSLLICGDATIRKLNAQHRSKDKVTDVLSFPALDRLRELKSVPHPLHLGDLALCFPQARRQAKEFSIGLWDEVIHLLIHGVIHLLGYDHEISEREERLMQSWEDRAVGHYAQLRKKLN